MGMSQAEDWVLLAYRLPRVPSTPRSAVWRKLKRLGVAWLGDGLVALPADPRTREQLEWVAEEVTEHGGEAMVWLGRPLDASAASVVAGCGKGTFGLPAVARDGSFEADGTFAYYVGPPPLPGTVAPPAHFHGVVTGSALTLRIERAGGPGVGPITFFYDGPEPKRPITPPCP